MNNRINGVGEESATQNLINDKDIDVCRTVPQQGYGPDKHINVKEQYGPATVPEQGYRLNILVKIKI